MKRNLERLLFGLVVALGLITLALVFSSRSWFMDSHVVYGGF